MRLFIRQGYQLSSLSVSAKLVYTIFLTFVALGIWTSWAIYKDRIGGELRGPAGQPSVEERYVTRPAEAPAADAGGPELDLPDEPAPAEPAPDLKAPWVMDVFHQHLFSVGVVFLILAHLFMLTGLHPAIKGTAIVLTGVTSLVHVLAPVIIWATGGWLWLMPVSGASMGVTWSAMVLWTFGSMWLGGRRAES